MAPIVSNDPPNELESTAVGPLAFDCQDELLRLFEVLSNVMFCIKGADNKYQAVNAAFVRRAGKSSKRDVIGKRATDLFAPELAARYEEQDSHLLSSGTPLRDELELIRRVDGNLGWYVTTKLPITSGVEIVGLASISRDLATPSDEGVAVESLTGVVNYVRNNLDQPIRVADLAEAAGCGDAQLERRMKSVFGLTAMQYVLRARVDRATYLLRTTDTPLSVIATGVGFYDQADFTRRFVRLTNETPAQYRRSVR